MHAPTREQINVYDSLDEQRAVRNFLGKDLDAAEALFRENSLYYVEDLMWMGPVAFRYYITAAIRYVHSDASSQDSSMASGLASVLEFWFEHYESELRPISVPLADVCDYVAARRSKFDLIAGYAGVPDRFASLRDRLRATQT
ncbi:MAG: hypothetical protein ACKVS9_01365 [Phycisphaerae bacterium]